MNNCKHSVMDITTIYTKDKCPTVSVRCHDCFLFAEKATRIIQEREKINYELFGVPIIWKEQYKAENVASELLMTDEQITKLLNS